MPKQSNIRTDTEREKKDVDQTTRVKRIEAQIVKKTNFCRTTIYRFIPQMTASLANASNEKNNNKLEWRQPRERNRKKKRSPKETQRKKQEMIRLRFSYLEARTR